MEHDDDSHDVQSNLVQLDQTEIILYRIAPPTTTTISSTSTTNTATTTTSPSPIDAVTVNVTWTFTNETNVTNVVMIVKKLQSAQWAALGLGQNQSMVTIRECFSYV